MSAPGPECVKTPRQNWSVCVYVKSEIYWPVSRCGFRIEARLPVRFWVPVAPKKRVYTASARSEHQVLTNSGPIHSAPDCSAQIPPRCICFYLNIAG